MAQNTASGNFRHHEFSLININTYHVKRDADLADATSEWEYGEKVMIGKGTSSSPASDIFSVGFILYELVLGQPVFPKLDSSFTVLGKVILKGW
jgi:serine/threonine protein kinase